LFAHQIPVIFLTANSDFTICESMGWSSMLATDTHEQEPIQTPVSFRHLDIVRPDHLVAQCLGP
jgi:hypothetical protein